MKIWDVIIVGAGAAGLMCAIEAGKRGRSVLILERANKPGKKILMSGGGRCNFTNLAVTADNYISHNQHFCKSALSRYTPADFIKLVKKHRIKFHEKTKGQLFCDNKSQDVLSMLLQECAAVNVTIKLMLKISKIEALTEQQANSKFKIESEQSEFYCQALVIATGGLSIPTLGATPFGYQVAMQFGIHVWPTQAGLVPFTLHSKDKDKFAPLSGVAVDSIVSTNQVNRESMSTNSAGKTISFAENILFTHRGLSGPAILQISSYWQPGAEITINLLALLEQSNFLDQLRIAQQQQPQKLLKTAMAEYLPKRVVETFLGEHYTYAMLSSFSSRELEKIVTKFCRWSLIPNATEGYRTAEVTLGGVDCDALSSKTMEAKSVNGLYFIGEVVDVTGWLGGYNFQWAWSSGWAAGQVV